MPHHNLTTVTVFGLTLLASNKPSMAMSSTLWSHDEINDIVSFSFSIFLLYFIYFCVEINIRRRPKGVLESPRVRVVGEGETSPFHSSDKMLVSFVLHHRLRHASS